MATQSTDTDAESPPNRDRSDEQPGPALLNQRPLLGIFVHVIALVTGVLGAGLIYYVADHEFTKENARNALNWHMLHTGFQILFFGFVIAFVLVADRLPVPDVVVLLPILVILGGMLVSTLLFVLYLVYPIVATVKAIFGDAWQYPFVPEFV